MRWRSSRSSKARREIASRARPFLITARLYGGGGLLPLALRMTGMRMFDALFEFGIFIAFTFNITLSLIGIIGGHGRRHLAEAGQ